MDNSVLNSSGLGARNCALSRYRAHKSAGTRCAGRATGYHGGEVLGGRNRRPETRSLPAMRPNGLSPFPPATHKCAIALCAAGTPVHHVGEARSAGRRRAARIARIMGEESRLNVLHRPALRLRRNRPGRQRCGSDVDNAHAESEWRRNVQHHKRCHRRNDQRPHGDRQLDQHPRFHQAAADTKQAEIEYRQCQYAIPPVELGRKGEYEPQCARREKQQEGDGDQIDAVPNNGLLAAKRRRWFDLRHPLEKRRRQSSSVSRCLVGRHKAAQSPTKSTWFASA